MTGHVYLNSAIWEWPKEITSKLDEIKFSDVKRYIDTPVNAIAAGWLCDCFFAVASGKNLIIDEVLAVGDEFRKKAIGKMQDISKGR
jgi:ABC-type polysaccharide/polyol phosphate transport system ATPase subunit